MIGVYAFKHKDGPVYVGATIDIERRRVSHLRSLFRGSHKCKQFQGKWDSSKEADWEFVFLESCSIEELKSVENSWMQAFQHRLLNSYKKSYGEGGRRHTLETRLKMSASAREKILRDGPNVPSQQARKKLSEKAKEQHRLGILGGHTISDEGKKRLHESSKKNWENGTPKWFKLKHTEETKARMREAQQLRRQREKESHS